MATKKDKPRSLGELLPKLEARSDAAWKRHVEKNARIGESWEEAGARLRKEEEAAANLAPPEPATGQKSQQERPEETPEAPSSHFVADTRGAEIKDDIASMEHPIFALKAGDKRVRVYERNGCTLTIKPGYDGCATIHDKDLWLYCISQLVDAKNRGEIINRTVRFTMHDFLKSTNRDTGGKGYVAAAQMLGRLAGTRIETNIAIKGYRERGFFGLIDSARVIERDGDERMVAVEVTLSNWLFASIESMQVLTLPSDYYRIRSALDRRIYELARKHCGHQPSWTVSIKTLHEKSGSATPIRNFRIQIKKLAKANELPDYRIRFDEEADAVTFYDKGRMGFQAEAQKLLPHLAGQFGIPAKKPRKKRNS